ncbi:MAG: sulfate adenylyltransferase subunit CysN [Planctomycetales bacterium]|nr:sulfate adenylyltransferase subunit CysN [Planctomycetales bacterium]
MTQTTTIDACLTQHNARDLLRFITCGNVDDGKSTLIGRLLLEAGAIYDDQIAALRSESEKHGTVGDRIDTALLLDGLEDERQQGITIDVAYRYFTTPTRKFIIADTPGHEQFTRNMATGASTADLAIILVDATKGISTQTRRHAFIVSLLGIKHIVLAVNKMDLVGYRQEVFDAISAEFDRFAEGIALDDVCPIPLSALEGDNVIAASDRMRWYDGPTLLQQLDSVQTHSDRQSNPLRFPIQWVNRPDAAFRGFSGTIASGTLRVGEQITVLPSQKMARIKSIVTMDGALEHASAFDSITVTLDSEIDVTRGDMLVSPHALPTVGRRGEATLVWMAEQPLVPGKSYWFKHTTRRTSCEVEAICFRTDVNTLGRTAASSLALNEIGRCQIKMHDQVMFDPYSTNRETGSFIMVDRITHETVAAGMFCDISSDPATAGHWDQQSAMVARKPARSRISAEGRQIRYGQNPLTVLITGLSSSGKTSVAMALEEQLFLAGRTCIVLDGQNMRMGISRDLGFTAEERSENLRRAAEIAKLINDSGQICIAAFVAPSAWVRQKARELIGEGRFFHVHLSTPSHVCRARDLTGQYQAADKGEISSFPGVTFDYEAPEHADLTFDTHNISAEQVALAILAAIEESHLK